MADWNTHTVFNQVDEPTGIHLLNADPALAEAQEVSG